MKRKIISIELFITVIFFILQSLLLNSIQAQSTPAIVFVSRNYVSGGSQYYQQMGLLPGMGPYSRFTVTGGRLLVRESNSSIRVLVDSNTSFNGIRLIDVSDPCVNWDGIKILFAGVEHRDSSWRIYEISSDGSNFRKVTFSNRNISLSQFGAAAQKFVKYDDIDPCYLPDGRICFSSTRYPSLSFFGFRTTNLYVMNYDGSNLHRITTERNSAEEPSVDPITGKLIFSRWWVNIDMPSDETYNNITRDTNLALTNDIGNMWWAARINPDGSGMELYAGSFKNRNSLHTYKPVITEDAKLLSVFIPNTSMTNTSGSSGIRWFDKGISSQNFIAGVNMDNMQSYNNLPASWGIMQPPYATDPIELPDGKILYSYASQVENSDYALYTININGSGHQLLFDIPGKLELNASVLQANNTPPVIEDVILEVSDELPPTSDPQTFFKNGALRFDCGNIFTNAGVDIPITDAPPITKHARIKLFLNFQRTDSTGKDSAILFLNEPVQHSGGFWIPMIPADIPVFDQVVDSAGKVLKGTKGQIAHLSGLNFGKPGTGTQCVGCHAGHSFIPPPQNNFEAQFTNTSTSAAVTQSSYKILNQNIQFPGNRVKDRKARNDSLTVNWIANGTQNEWVNLKWDIPIDVRKFVLYNIRANASNNTNIQVNDCEIFIYFQGQQVGHVPSTGAISVDGSVISIEGYPKIDEAKIIVKSFTGLIDGQSAAGLAEVETNARISYYDIIGIANTSTTAERFKLSQNYPNPFNPVTNIMFNLPFTAFVKVTIYDILGKELKILVDDQLNAGSYNIDWDASGFPSGVYFYKMETRTFVVNSWESFFDTKKMILLK
ncbi:MAG: T9SS type A sorting domain-containing protein [Ignavibacteria bacterium]|nr:T9SS type A sorting domain-containing protein [Ignavibacteria bacterium]